MHRIYSNMLHIHLSIRYGGDSLGGDNDSDRGVPEQLPVSRSPREHRARS